MDRERIIVQRLIKALDDARLRYDEWADKLAHPGLRDVLQRVARVHWRIAESLAAQMVGTGTRVARQGSRLGPLRTCLVDKFAQMSVDIDLVYASHAVKREVRILRDFRGAVDSIRDAGLCNRLRMHCREIEHASTGVRCLLTTMQLQLHRALPPRGPSRARASGSGQPRCGSPSGTATT
jgi:hypothetical protein